MKKFNTTGSCVAGVNYMADTSMKLQNIYAMVLDGKYFTINRPRQYGKTTNLYQLTRLLNHSGEYIAIRLSFEGIGDELFKSEGFFCTTFWEMVEDRIPAATEGKVMAFFDERLKDVRSLRVLSKQISSLVSLTDKKIVLLIDEVDKSSNNQLFVSFLGVLRDKYLAQRNQTSLTFHCVVLAGVHDVRSLKLKISPNTERKNNSPWNIAANFEVDMNLQVPEIVPMLEDYAQERGIRLDAQVLATRLFHYTSGYPFLVSKLCQIVDEKLMPQKTTEDWLPADLDKAVQMLLVERNVTNFDSLFGNLEDHPNVLRLAERLIFDGEALDFNPYDPTVNLGILHGVFADSGDESHKLKIHNRVYRECIANYCISKWNTTMPSDASRAIEGYNYKSQFARPDGSLDFELVLTRFQAFMREQYHKADRDFLEQQGRLVFLAFIKPIINGSGYDFKEPQLSEERRTDVVITYNQYRYVSELKIWRGPAAHNKGLAQLGAYLDTMGLSVGYLVIFDHSGTKSWDKGWILEEVPGKKIFAVWV